ELSIEAFDGGLGVGQVSPHGEYRQRAEPGLHTAAAPILRERCGQVSLRFATPRRSPPKDKPTKGGGIAQLTRRSGYQPACSNTTLRLRAHGAIQPQGRKTSTKVATRLLTPRQPCTS